MLGELGRDLRVPAFCRLVGGHFECRGHRFVRLHRGATEMEGLLLRVGDERSEPRVRGSALGLRRLGVDE